MGFLSRDNTTASKYGGAARKSKTEGRLSSSEKPNPDSYGSLFKAVRGWSDKYKSGGDGGSKPFASKPRAKEDLPASAPADDPSDVQASAQASFAQASSAQASSAQASSAPTFATALATAPAPESALQGFQEENTPAPTHTEHLRTKNSEPAQSASSYPSLPQIDESRFTIQTLNPKSSTLPAKQASSSRKTATFAENPVVERPIKSESLSLPAASPKPSELEASSPPPPRDLQPRRSRRTKYLIIDANVEGDPVLTTTPVLPLKKETPKQAPQASTQSITLPDGTLVENVKAHIQSLEVQMAQDQTDIEDAKDNTIGLQRQLDEVAAQIPEAENTRDHANAKKQQGEREFEDAVKILNEKKLRADREFEEALKQMNAKKAEAERDFETSVCAMKEKKSTAERNYDDAVKSLETLLRNKEDYQTQVIHNDSVEREKAHNIQANKELIELLKSLSKAGEFAALTKQGKYRCDFCGQIKEAVKKEKHEKKCWGRCKRCHKKGIECDAGGPKKEWHTCTGCQKSGSQCLKMDTSRKLARVNSIVKLQG